MKSSIVQKCLDVLKKDEFKKEWMVLAYSILEMCINVLRPYMIYVIIFIVFNTAILLFILYYLMKMIKLLKL